MVPYSNSSVSFRAMIVDRWTVLNSRHFIKINVVFSLKILTKDRLKRALKRAKSDSASTISQEIHDFNTIYQADARGLHEVTIKVSFDGTISLWADIYRVKSDDLRKFHENELLNPVFKCFHHEIQARLLLYILNFTSLADIHFSKSSERPNEVAL